MTGRVLTVALVLLAATLPAEAFEAVLPHAEMEAAIASGRAQASVHRGYSVADHVVYSVPDALTIVSGAGPIEAVVIATPLEQVRYESYLAAFEGHPLARSKIDQAATPNQVEILMFAHSHTQNDQRFLRRFVNARLDSPLAGSLRPTRISVFGPALDFYNLMHHTRVSRVLRWTGYVAYRFDLGPLVAKGIAIKRFRGMFSVVDPSGRRESYRIDFGRYK